MSYDITIKQGKTFSVVFRYASEPVVFKDITAIQNSVPMQMTVPAHGLIDGWVAAIVGVEDLAVNSPPRANDYKEATVIDVNTLQFNDIDATNIASYQSGGKVRYFTPVDLAGYTARMKIKKKPGGDEYASLASPTEIVLDNVAKTITVTIPATDTAAYTFTNAQYDLELESAGGVVVELASGNVELVKEITA